MGSPEAALVGALFPLSGRAAPLGRTGYQGARLAAEEINEAGGVLGGPLDLQVADTRGPLGTVAEARAGTRASDALGLALEGMTLDLPRGPVTLRKEDHQAVLDMVWGRTRRHPDFPFAVLADLQVFPGTEITPTVEEVVVAQA